MSIGASVTPAQLRAARALLHLPQVELARRARVSVMTIRRLESSYYNGRTASPATGSVQQVLEESGVEFIPGGVRHKHIPKEPDKTVKLTQLKAISRMGAARLRGIQPLTDDDLYDENGFPS